MKVINISLNGTAEQVVNDLTEAASDIPETEIRKALADYISRETEPEDTASVSVSITINL